MLFRSLARTVAAPGSAAVNDSAAVADAIELVALDPSPEATAILLDRLAGPLDVPGTEAVLRSLRDRDQDAVCAAIVAAWPAASPGVRRTLLGFLLRPEGLAGRVPHLLAAIEEGTISPGDIDPEARQALLADLLLGEEARGRLGGVRVIRVQNCRGAAAREKGQRP